MLVIFNDVNVLIDVTNARCVIYVRLQRLWPSMLSKGQKCQGPRGRCPCRRCRTRRRVIHKRGAGKWVENRARFLGEFWGPSYYSFNRRADKWGWFPGSFSTPVFDVISIFSRQAMAAWQWWNFCENQVPMGKEVFRINMDETSVCLWQGDGKGIVFADKGRHRWMFGCKLQLREFSVTLASPRFLWPSGGSCF